MVNIYIYYDCFWFDYIGGDKFWFIDCCYEDVCLLGDIG